MCTKTCPNTRVSIGTYSECRTGGWRIIKKHDPQQWLGLWMKCNLVFAPHPTEQRCLLEDLTRLLTCWPSRSLISSPPLKSQSHFLCSSVSSTLDHLLTVLQLAGCAATRPATFPCPWNLSPLMERQKTSENHVLLIHAACIYLSSTYIVFVVLKVFAKTLGYWQQWKKIHYISTLLVW